MSNEDESSPPKTENTPLLPGESTEKNGTDSVSKGEVPNIAGVKPGELPPTFDIPDRFVVPAFKRQSMHVMSNNPLLQPLAPAERKMPPKSYSIHANGSVSYLTPAQMGRQELYEHIPFTAVFGLQKKERNMSFAFASYAADLDVMEADKIAIATNKKHLSSTEVKSRHSHASLVIMDELELDSVMVTTPLIFAVFVAAMSQFLVGYNTGVMNAPSEVVFPNHSTTEWSLAVAAFAVGGPFGANIAGSLADSRGRRGALVLNMWLFLIGGIVQTFAVNMNVIIASRFIIGFASGFASVLVPIYLGELAPPTLRGTLGTLTQFALVIGILFSDLLAFPFATEENWRFLFAATPLITILQLLCTPFLLESPRWLLTRDLGSRKARYIIKKLRGLRYDHEVETEVELFSGAMKAQTMKPDDEKSSKSGFMQMISDKSIRLLVVSCFLLQISQQLCGINAVFYYSSAIFEGVIDNPLVGTTLVGAVNVLATYAALLLMDSWGRRTLLLWSSGGMLVSSVILVLALLNYFSNVVALVAVNAYVAFFEIGLGPIPWLIVAEMFDAKYVAVVMSAACQLNWACNFIVGLVFPYMNDYLGPYSFAPFAGVLLLAFLFTAIWLPETQGTTPEELQAELVRKNSTTIYHNISVDEGSNAVNMEWKQAMDQLRREEDEAMRTGGYDFGFEPIVDDENPSVSQGWQSSVIGPK